MFFAQIRDRRLLSKLYSIFRGFLPHFMASFREAKDALMPGLKRHHGNPANFAVEVEQLIMWSRFCALSPASVELLIFPTENNTQNCNPDFDPPQMPAMAIRGVAASISRASQNWNYH